MNGFSHKYADGKPPRWQAALFRVRHVVLVGYVGLLVVFVVLVYLNEETSVPGALAAVLGLVVAQAGFLAGAPHFTWPRPRHRRSMIVSKIFAAALAALLTFGFGATMVSALELMRGTKAFTSLDGRLLIFISAGLWIGWSVLFLLIWTSEWLPQFRRLYKWIVGGTILELLVTIPVDVQIRKRANCYCNEGTFFAMVIGVTVLIWSFGPGIVLLYFTRRMQRRANLGYCEQCGYDLRGLPEPRCPECGKAFERGIETRSIHP